MVKINIYKNILTEELLTEKQFNKRCIDYINSKEWEDGAKPTIEEVKLNDDDIIFIGELYVTESEKEAM